MLFARRRKLRLLKPQETKSSSLADAGRMCGSVPIAPPPVDLPWQVCIIQRRACRRLSWADGLVIVALAMRAGMEKQVEELRQQLEKQCVINKELQRQNKDLGLYNAASTFKSNLWPTCFCQWIDFSPHPTLCLHIFFFYIFKIFFVQSYTSFVVIF